MEKKVRSLNSIKVSHEKKTASCITEKMSVPETVCISMAQHIGAPCKPLVAKGDSVKVGQIIGDTDAFVSAPIHSSVSGTVKEISSIRSITGGEDQVIIIETDGRQDLWQRIKPPVINDQKDFVKAIRASGLVGLGGASFPTHIKFNPKNLDQVDTLIVNGAECEPFITSDHRLMLEDTEYIIKGILATMKNLDLKRVYIGVEENKPDAISKLKEAIGNSGHSQDIEVKVLNSRYPQGAERVMVYEITGKPLNAGVLPADLGILLSNITTIAFIGQYLETGRPLTAKRITVDGNAVAEPKNIIVPIGTRIFDVVKACGGYKAEPRKILMGGPMMGRAVYSDAFPIVKNNNAILIFDGPQALIPEETGCIKCGMCIKACPFGLLPVSLAEAYERKDIERLKRLQVTECMECGSCSYICPARRPLSFMHKMAKGLLKEVASNNG
ncbi:electron transport complex subunit RsxC [Mogibacterium sp. NSJ-24]|jgi:Na+-translocating ferredoxin:NAD+ oxidoreductase subunit C|uniref:Ion-translocating oxidoreductase complex subunit C n=1 Tax=Lentihominibacter hominis TaxID=2763645 RepID=A0A926E4M6_9FIRM|nr:electron transport complex subunit RsxC [Lentihominibacter hominis]MBC8567710.1 electron transport complex subunit RsxC [Lentihominibacter hominis]